MGGNDTKGLTSNSPAKGEPVCKNVPVLPVRYALTSEKRAPMNGYGSFKWSGGSGKYYHGTLRTIESGWVHLWSLMNYPEGKSIQVKNGKFEGAEWLSLPLADPCVRIAYSRTPWSRDTWNKILKDHKILFTRMRQVPPKKMARYKIPQSFLGAALNNETHCAPINMLNELVEEYRNKPGYLYGLEELPDAPGATLKTRKIFDPDLSYLEKFDSASVETRWHYSFESLEWKKESNLAQKMTDAVCEEYTPFLVALEDPVGIARDYASVHSAYCGMQDVHLDWYAHQTSSAQAAVQLWKDDALSQFFSFQKATHGDKFLKIFLPRAPVAQKFLEYRFEEHKEISMYYFPCVLVPWMKHMQIKEGCSLSFVFDCDFSDKINADAEKREQTFGQCIEGISAHSAGIKIVLDELMSQSGKLGKTPLGKLLLKVAESQPLSATTEHTEKWLVALSNVLILPDQKGRLPKSHQELFEALDKRMPGSHKILTANTGATPAKTGEAAIFHARRYADNLEEYLYGQQVRAGQLGIYSGMKFSPNGTLRPVNSNGTPLINLTNQNNLAVLVRQKVLRGSIQSFAEHMSPGETIGQNILNTPTSMLDRINIPAAYTFSSIFWPLSLISRINQAAKGDGDTSYQVKASVMLCCQGATTILSKKLIKTAAASSLSGTFANLGSIKALSMSWKDILSLRTLGIMASVIGSGISMSLAIEGYEKADDNSVVEKMGHVMTFAGGAVLIFAGPAAFIFRGGKVLRMVINVGKALSLSGMALTIVGQKRPIHHWLESSYWGLNNERLNTNRQRSENEDEPDREWKNPNLFETYRLYDQNPLNVGTAFMNYAFPRFSLRDVRHMVREEDEIKAESTEMNELLRTTLEVKAKWENRVTRDGICTFLTFKATQAVPWQSKLEIEKDKIRLLYAENKSDAYLLHYLEAKYTAKEYLERVKDRTSVPLPDLFDDCEWITFQDEEGCACWRCYFDNYGAKIPKDLRHMRTLQLIIPIKYTYSETDNLTLETEIIITQLVMGS